MNGGTHCSTSPSPGLHRDRRRRLIGVGLLALNFPVFLDAYDQWGFQIKCGTGYLTDLTQAAARR